VSSELTQTSPRRMKVLYLTNGLTHYYNLVLNRLDQQPDMEVIVVVPGNVSGNIGEGVYQTESGVTFKFYRLDEVSRFRAYTTFKGLARLLMRETPDAIITSEIHLLGFVLSLSLVLTTKLLRVKLILQSIPFRLPKYLDAKNRCTERSQAIGQLPWLMMLMIRGLGLERVLRMSYLLLRKYAFRRVNAHLNYVEDAIDIFGSYGVPKEKIFITYNSPDTDAHIETEKLAETMPPVLPHSSQRLVHVGRLVEWKRVDLLLRAFARIRESFPAAELLVIGTGPLEERLKEVAVILKVDDSVRFVGGVYDPSLLARYLRASSVYVLAGMGGLSINDAMFHRLPIICSVCDGTEKKLVRDGFNGRFFREGDEDDLVLKISELLADPERCRQMGAHSREIIDKEINIHTVIAGYRQALMYVVSH